MTFDKWRITETPSGSARLLLVGGDLNIPQKIAGAIADHTCVVETAITGSLGLELALGGSFDVIITDHVLSDMNGLEFLARLRERAVQTPVLALSDSGAVSERVRSLRAGCDDCLAKPFELEELAARIEVLLRRMHDSRPTLLRVGPIVVDLVEQTVHRGGRQVHLRPQEFKILEYMCRHPNQILTRAMMLQKIWHYRTGRVTNLVDVHVGKLRRKLTTSGELEVILSVRGTGFMLTTHMPEELMGDKLSAEGG